MDGILLIDKPISWSSFDVVAKVRNILRKSNSPTVQQSNSPNTEGLRDKLTEGLANRKIRVGHTGTLDPLASGLMILVIGSYCKRAQEFSKLDKTYEVTMKLGQTSTTGDEEGVKVVASERVPSSEEIQETIKQFVGEIMQTPPAFSAIKINGQRAYKLARAGKPVALEPRKVTVNKLQLTDYIYPEVKFVVDVSSGTYIRSLVQDIGEALGTGAYMSGLRRVSVGQWNIGDALQMEGLTFEIAQDRLLEVTP